MQPKIDVSLASGVTEIIKTFISHPDHGLKGDDIPQLVRDVYKAFNEAAQTSGEAITAATSATTEQSAPVVEHAAEVAFSEPSAPEAPEEPAADAPAAPEEAPVAQQETPSPKKSRSKSREARAAEAPAEAVAAEQVAEAPAEKAPKKKAAAPQDPLEAKFGGKIQRNTWNNMDPMEAVQQDAIICLIDGLPRKMLHRHLLARYSMTPEEYRAWFNLPADYPMTAPGYSKEKSEYAKVVGLGTSKFAEKAKATPKTSRRERKGAKQNTGSRQRTTA
mgnify:CR=1 FL=1|jgi:Predicted transcriptional regulator